MPMPMRSRSRQGGTFAWNLRIARGSENAHAVLAGATADHWPRGAPRLKSMSQNAGSIVRATMKCRYLPHARQCVLRRTVRELCFTGWYCMSWYPS